jgi:hypothetical protein
LRKGKWLIEAILKSTRLIPVVAAGVIIKNRAALIEEGEIMSKTGSKPPMARMHIQLEAWVAAAAKEEARFLGISLDRFLQICTTGFLAGSRFFPDGQGIPIGAEDAVGVFLRAIARAIDALSGRRDILALDRSQKEILRDGKRLIEAILRRAGSKKASAPKERNARGH